MTNAASMLFSALLVSYDPLWGVGLESGRNMFTHTALSALKQMIQCFVWLESVTFTNVLHVIILLWNAFAWD